MQKRRTSNTISPKDPLKSTDAITLVRELSDQQIAIIRNNEKFGGEIVADRLQMLRNVVWGDKKTKKPAAEERQKKVFTAAMSGLTEQQQEQLLSSYARMGHLYEIGSLSARSNYFETIKQNPNDAIPDSIADLTTLAHKDSKELVYKNTGELVEKLNHPIFEIVMTAHPTNVNGPESMQAQREINKALEKHDQEALTKALIKYQETPLLKETVKPDGTKEAINLTGRDETKTSLYFLGNIYEDLPKVYGNYDMALSKHADTTQSSYDPTSLNLKIKFGSWGSSGDKDGNNNITAETTLEAIVLHTQAILNHYSKDLEKIPQLGRWKENFDSALIKLDPLVEDIGKLREDARKDQKDANSSAEKLNERFDNLSKQLAAIRNSLDGKGFETDLKTTAESGNKEALDMLRRFRIFGFNFSKIEYRETAKEYSRVVGELIDGYKDLKAEDKADKLTQLLHNPNEAAKILAEHEAEIIREGAGKSYSENSAKPIAYHTLKRMALARDFGDMIKDNVLAECGQLENEHSNGKTDDEKAPLVTAQGLTNILEAQFLQQAVTTKDGKHPKLGIVPLFEEPDTLRNIEKIMDAAYSNTAYRKHLEMLKENEKSDYTQQVQIAHSDNARRSGLQAARSFIHTAHHKMRELGKKHPGIQTQFFEGGSMSDTYRNGVRALSKTIDAFALHDFAKFTFQGGDLLNFFNHPSSIERLFDNAISHQTRILEDGQTEEKPKGKWEPRVVNSKGNTPNPEIEKLVNKALKKTLIEYQDLDFTDSTMGILLGALNYDKVKVDHAANSRSSEREISFANAKISIGAVHTSKNVDNAIHFARVPIKRVRTIVFSKTWQGAGIVPSWIGALALKDHLDTVFSNSDYNDTKKTGIPVAPLTPHSLKKIYDHSPTFHDAQDRSALAIALTDMDTAEKIAHNMLKFAPEDDKDLGIFYLDRVKKTYRAAAELAYSSVTGKSLNSSNLSNKQIQEKMIDALPHLKEDIVNKTSYRATLLHWQTENPEIFASKYMGRTAQSAKDTVEHGRWLGASDPSTTEHYKDHIAAGVAQR